MQIILKKVKINLNWTSKTVKSDEIKNHEIKCYLISW
jgi:hypothetical protein